MDEIVKEFLVENLENIDRLERDLVVLEKAPRSEETLASIFRTIHTLKGTSGFLGFGKLEAVAHAAENLLSKLRDGVYTVTPEMIGALLSTLDATRFMLGQVEATGETGDKDFPELVALLEQLNESGHTLPAPVILAEAIVPAVEVAVSSPQEIAPLPVDAPAALAEATENRSSAISESTIRVNVGLLDKLMNLVGELVLARNQVLQFTSRSNDSSLLAASQRLNLITTELQGSVMKTRMQPIGNVWSKLPRVVRDLSVACGKQVRIEMLGQETEMDKTIIEAIKDPLTHIVRNSIDHGIESPEARLARGKHREGCLKLSAYHEGGQVNIEIADDGGGIDGEKVKNKAVQRGLITPDQAMRMGEHEALHLIFLPGFSTAETVTNLSGRGVGMDVVKTNIEKIGGTVDLQSQVGVGTVLRIKIPLTLAIIPALIVTSHGNRFAIPQANLLELVRLDESQKHKNIEYIHDTPVYRLRGKLLPLVYLDRELKLEDDLADGSAPEAENIVVLQANGRPFGLVVQAVNDTEEIVVKPLSKQLKGITAFAGATIMGDGRVVLILDVLGLAQCASVLTGEREGAHAGSTARSQLLTDDSQALLVFEVGQGGRMAVPLSQVTRLEEVQRSSVEYSGRQEVIRYRGQILPLIDVAGQVHGEPSFSLQGEDSMQVIVYSEQGRSVGLVVGRISDVVEEAITVKRTAQRNGILGSVAIHDKVTDLLDVQAVIRAADPSFYMEN